MNLKRIKLSLNLWRVAPLWRLCHTSKAWPLIEADLKRWKQVDKKKCSDFQFFGNSLLTKKEFRNLLQYRLHYAKSYVADFFTRFFFPTNGNIDDPSGHESGGAVYTTWFCDNYCS